MVLPPFMLSALRCGGRVQVFRICKAFRAHRNPHGFPSAGIGNAPVRRYTDEASGAVIGDSSSPEDQVVKSHSEEFKAELRLKQEAKEKLVSQILSLPDGGSVDDVLHSWIKQCTVVDSKIQDAHVVAPPDNQDRLQRTLHAVVHDLGQRGLPEIAWQVFRWMQLQGLASRDPHLYTTLINMFGHPRSLDWVEKLYSSLEDLQVKVDTELLNAVLDARSRSGRVEAALELFQKMEHLPCKRDEVTYHIMMDTCVKLGTSLASVLHLFKKMVEEGIQPNIISYNILLSACVAGKHVKEAVNLFNLVRKKGLKPTVVTYTSLMRVHICAGNSSEALKVYRQMVARGCRPSAVTFSILIAGCTRQGLFEEAESIFEGMEELGLRPTVSTFNAMMDMYCNQFNPSGAQQIMEKMSKAGLQPNVVTFTTLMTCYKAVGAVEKALSVYDSVKAAPSLCNVLTFTEALDACLKDGPLNKAADILAEMKAAGHEPTIVTCAVILSALGAKSRNDEDTYHLLNMLQQFESKLVHTCLSLLSNVMDDDKVAEHVKDMLALLEMDDEKTRIVFFVALIDALWMFRWFRRAALVLGWLMRSGVLRDICVLSPQEWKLDVRHLSTGGSLVAFYQWMSHLSYIAVHFESSKRQDVSEARNSSDEVPTEPGVDQLLHSPKDTEPESPTTLEVVLPLLPSYWHDTSSLPGQVYRLPNVQPSDGASGSPRIVTVVTGWGKLSRHKGTSTVKAAVEKELAKLRAPFHPSEDSGRWMASFGGLMYWLLRPQTAGKMALHDSPRKRKM